MGRAAGESRSERRSWWGAVLMGSAVGAAATASLAFADLTETSPYHNLSTFARALSHIEASYVEPADQDRLIQGAIRGMVDTLDPHSAYMDPEEYRILTSDTEGRFGGVGVEVDVEDDWLTVVSVFDNGPAKRAGVKVGDRFLSIDDYDARDMRIEEAVRRMRGEPGSRVTVRLRRASEPQAVAVTLTREIILVRAVEARILEDRVVVLRLRSFQETTTTELRRALDLAVQETDGKGGVAGVLLDLRDNPGGLLDEAVLVSDEFLESGVIVSTRGRGGRLLGEYQATRAGTRPNWPLVVLVNGYTASAAEILAGALRDQRRAVLVGTRTFGKGSVQNIMELPDGSGLKFTIARYYTPSGRSIQAQGIVPDVVVEALDDSAAQPTGSSIREEVLEGHLETERPSLGSRTSESRDAPRADGAPLGAGDPFEGDYQARMAYQTLRALIIARP